MKKLLLTPILILFLSTGCEKEVDGFNNNYFSISGDYPSAKPSPVDVKITFLIIGSKIHA
jgi:hypothetical protein